MTDASITEIVRPRDFKLENRSQQELVGEHSPYNHVRDRFDDTWNNGSIVAYCGDFHVFGVWVIVLRRIPY
jgi:hypothetical protein